MGLCPFSQKALVLAISHRRGCVKPTVGDFVSIGGYRRGHAVMWDVNQMLQQHLITNNNRKIGMQRV